MNLKSKGRSLGDLESTLLVRQPMESSSWTLTVDNEIVESDCLFVQSQIFNPKPIRTESSQFTFASVWALEPVVNLKVKKLLSSYLNSLV